jgi:tellurite resistance-related uncharacterized protein
MDNQATAAKQAPTTSHTFNDDSEDLRFTPELQWSKPRPQLLFSLTKIAVGTVGRASLFLGGDITFNELDGELRDLDSRVWMVDEAHEAYLSGKAWPQI